MKWCVTSPLMVYDRSEESVVVLHLASGNTHLISRLALRVLQGLESQPLLDSELTKSLALDSQLSELEPIDRDQYISDLLRDLDQIHLIELA
ncbi:MAG: HPr-rel-A system PqqD family peptide chaperone [Pseudomonadota bacterium]